MSNRWSIRRYLILLVLAVNLPLLVWVIYSMKDGYRHALRETEADSLRLTEIVAADTAGYVANARNSLEELAVRPLNRAPMRHRCDPILQDLMPFFGSLGNIAIADRQGKLVCSALPLPQGTAPSVADTAWFKAVSQSNAFTTGTPHIGPVSDRWVSVLAQPLQDDAGRFNGVIGLTIDLLKYHPIPGSVPLGDGMIVYIVNDFGVIVSSSKDQEAWVGKAFPDQRLLETSRRSPSGAMILESGGSQHLVTHAAIAGTDWHVVNLLPASLVFEEFSRHAKTEIFLLTLIAIAGVTCSLLIWLHIVRPVSAIAQTAQAVANGGYASRVVVEGPREIVAVAENFNHMLEIRQQADEEIRRLNERLRYLIEAIKELSTARDLESVQRIVSSSARKLTGADGATITLRENSNCHYAEEDAIAPLWKGSRFPLTSCISGWVMLHETPAVVPDIYADDRIPLAAYRSTFVKSLVTVPVITDKAIAAIGNYWQSHHVPTAIEVEMLQTLADAAARAIENVHLLTELERRVAIRTADLEAANRELDAFAYSVSHDLRAPLRAIDAFSRILLDEYAPRLDDEGRRLCGIVSANTRRMGQLIDDLLTFSRLGRVGFRKVAVDMTALADAAFHETVAPPQRASLDFRLAPLPPALGDPDLLRQVWVNLLSNAIKFSAQQERPVIEITATESAGEVVYSVRDNGAGFDMRYADKLFGVFQRLHGEKDFPGTGLGLALAQRIVQRHGGRIWGEGTPGAGATFSFTLKSNEV